MPTSGYVVGLHTERPILAYAVRQLYDLVDWWPRRHIEQIDAVLNQGPAVGAWQGDDLVGFARAVTDGCFRAYIEDVIVHPQYQRKGVASLLMVRLLDALKDVETVSLFCKPAFVPLYGQCGFKVHPSQVVMHHAILE